MPEAKEAQLSVVSKPDPALIAAWRRFLDYDRVSTNQKKEHQQLRNYVITLGLFTSAGAVFSVYVQEIPFFAWIFRIALIIMPIVSVAMMNYAAQFASSISWIEYRFAAENIRSHIYMYRLKAGPYKDLDKQESQQKLLETIAEGDRRIDEKGATQPDMAELDDSILQKIAAKTEARGIDDGISEITIQNYIDWRLKKQLNWYVQKIQNDYSKLKEWRTYALVVAGAGSVISAIGLGLEILVAATTAMGVALTLLSETRMYGATYGIFHYTAGRLQTALNQWEVLTGEQQREKVRQAIFITQIETIFKDEQDLWRSSAAQSQTASDQAISSQLQKTLSPEQIKQFRQVGLPVIAGVGKEFVENSPIDPNTHSETASAG